LGNALHDKQQLDEAIREYRTAIELNPKYAFAHNGLGNALSDKKQLDEAIREYRTAIELDPKSAVPRNGLGATLVDKKLLDEAIREYRTAIELEPRYATAHNNLGNALRIKKDLVGAMRCYRNAIDLAPDFAQAHCNLGHALRDIGKFTEALAALKRGHGLGSRRNDRGSPSAQWVRHCEHLIELDRKLAAIFKGDAQPANATERLELASLCEMSCKRLHVAAARFCAEALAAEPKLADPLHGPIRYNAARNAILAAAGHDADATKFDAQERTRLRKQALDWLRADLDAWIKFADDAKEHGRICQTLQRWQTDPEFASVRGDALPGLSETEGNEWLKLWADVQALMKKIEAKR
jgi:tetratricopeptide (TPR) repeat protein